MSMTEPGRAVPTSTIDVEVENRRLEAILADAAGARNLAEAGIVAAVADALESDAWKGWGIASIEHWISWNVGASRSRARDYSAIARRRAELPASWNLFSQGMLTVDQMRLISRYCPTEYDASVGSFATGATVVQLARSLRHYHWDADRPAASAVEEPAEEPADPTPVRRSAVLHLGDNGEYELRVIGPVIDGVRVNAALEQFRALVRDGTESDAHEVTSYDGFLALVDAAVGADPSASRHSRHRGLFHLDVDHSGSLAGRLHLGPLVDDDELRHLSCDADMQTLFQRSGQALHLGRTRRTVPNWLRSIVVDRDGGCRFPDCHRTVNLDVHHMIHWVDGGKTDPENLVTLCSRHHRLHHQGQFSIAGEPHIVPRPGTDDGLVFRNPFGLVLRAKQPNPPTRPSKAGPPGPTYRRAYGERLDYRMLYFNAGPSLN